MKYTFESVEDTEKLSLSSKICNLIESYADYGNQLL